VEHRCGERLSMRLPATVYKTNGEAVGVTIRNLSSGGAYVELPADGAMLRGLVELELCLPGEESRSCLWRAYVIRQQTDGAGLMFDDRWSAERLPFLAAQRSMQRSVQRSAQATTQHRVGERRVQQLEARNP